MTTDRMLIALIFVISVIGLILGSIAVGRENLHDFYDVSEDETLALSGTSGKSHTRKKMKHVNIVISKQHLNKFKTHPKKWLKEMCIPYNPRTGHYGFDTDGNLVHTHFS